MFQGKTIIVGVTGCIAAYKMHDVCNFLTREGADVHVVMTKNATQFATPLTFQVLSKNHVYVDTFEDNDPKVINHVHLADLADLILIAPATANTISSYANGLANNMITNILLATANLKKILISPAMNVNMLYSPPIQENIKKIKSWGINVLEPAVGRLACGYDAEGKLPNKEIIIEKCKEVLSLNQNDRN